MSNSIQLLHQFLERSARLCPAKTALVCTAGRVPYDLLNRSANAFAHFLIDNNVQKGDRIALICENGFEFVLCCYGAMKAGAVPVPLHNGTRANTLRMVFNDVQPFCIVAARRVANEVERALPQVVSKPIVIESAGPADSYVSIYKLLHDSIKGRCDDNPATRVHENDLASIIYTSGSTGAPRGVMLSHKNLVSNTCAICEALALTEHDIQMAVLPFSYVMGASLLNTHVAVGGTVVINNSFGYTAAVLQQMIDEKVTGLSGVPSTFAHLLYRSPLAANRDKLVSLRYCSQAGGHMPARIKMELRRALPDHTVIYIMYGATEASARLTVLDPNRFDEKMGSIGTPVNGVSIAIVNDANEEVAAGATGELVAAGPNIMQGYWNDAAGTRLAIDDRGYYHTGDLGFRDGQGFFYITGRKDLQIKVHGHRINPQEIEDALVATGLVVEAVVIGVDDHESETRIKAVVSPKDKYCSSDNIQKELAAILPRFKHPDMIVLRSSLPKNAHGKLDRDACRSCIVFDKN